MHMIQIIEKKRDGQTLSREEIFDLVEEYTQGNIPDYQMSAFLMAVYLNGMTKEETFSLTEAMVLSGDQLDLSEIHGFKIDKHSTGGVGDKTTLILGPMVSACQVPVAKMSGRGLGFTGGTIDKLEAIPGFQTSKTEKQFIKQVNEIGYALSGQTGHLAPADKKIYALRDVTGTVSSLPLIASSIMSKKIASGADGIVLDVKVGNGAFMKTMKEAKELAGIMIEIGRNAGKRMAAVVSDMSQPLGYAIGNSLEVMEAVEVLKGRGPADVRELCLSLGSQMLVLADRVEGVGQGKTLLKDALDSGKALKQFEKFVVAQGGDPAFIQDYSKLPTAKYSLEILAMESGYVAGFACENIGKSLCLLGGGRMEKGEKIDPAVGIVLEKKVGDTIERGETLARVYGNNLEKLAEAEKLIKQSILCCDKDVKKGKLVLKRIM